MDKLIHLFDVCDNFRVLKRADELLQSDHENSEEIYLYKIKAQIALFKEQEALNTINEAISRFPNNLNFYNEKAVALIDLAKFEDAKVCLKAVLNLDENNLTALNNLIFLLEESNANYEEIVSLCDRTIPLDNTDPSAYLTRATANRKLLNFNEAIIDIKKALSIDDDIYLSMSHADLGLTYYDMKDYHSAKLQYDKAIELDQDDPFYYIKLAQTLGELGRIQEGIEEVGKAIDIDLKLYLAFAVRANLYRLLGDKKQALFNLQRAKVLQNLQEKDPEGDRLITFLDNKIELNS